MKAPASTATSTAAGSSSAMDVPREEAAFRTAGRRCRRQRPRRDRSEIEDGPPGNPVERDRKLALPSWEDAFLRTPAEPFEGASPYGSQRRMLRRAYLSFHLRPRVVVGRLRRALRHPDRELRTLALGARTWLPAVAGA